MTAPSKGKLKPCPFCGKVRSLDIEHRTGNIFVVCSNCYAEGPGSSESFDLSDKFRNIHSDAEAIAAWNRRAR